MAYNGVPIKAMSTLSLTLSLVLFLPQDWEGTLLLFQLALRRFTVYHKVPVMAKTTKKSHQYKYIFFASPLWSEGRYYTQVL